MKKKIKLQIKSKARGPGYPKWVPPEKRMKTLADYGVNDQTGVFDSKWKKVKWPEFRVVVPNEYSKQQLLSAFEYIHNNDSVMDNDFIAVNAIAHSYITPELESGAIPAIIVDYDLYNQLNQRTCPHPKEYQYFLDGIKYCKLCRKALEVTSG